MIFWKLFKKNYERAAERMCYEISSFLKRGEKVLDLGCGCGIFGWKMKETLGVNVFGLDVVDKRVIKIPFQIYNGKKIPFPENFFDWVVISFVLHHTENFGEILEEAKRVGKKIIIFEDIPKGVFGKIRCWLHLLTFNGFLGKIPKFNFFSEKEWEEIFQKMGLKLKEKREFRLPFDFLDPVKRKIFILEK